MGTVKTKGGSMNKITSTKDMQIDYAKVVVYGPPGAGKTTFGATFPDTLILSAESGLLSVMDEELMVKPALSGKTLSDELAGWVDAVIYCPGPQKDEEGHVQYLGQTVPGRGRMAKVRVPAGVSVPTYIKLSFNELQGIMFPELTEEV